jgi:DNA-binding transcriptional regulator YiaG
MSDARETVEAARRFSNGVAGFSEDHDLKEQLKELSHETIALIRQELELVRAELAEKTDFLKEQLQLTTTQARYELEQTKTELAEIGKKAGVGAGLFGSATLLGLGAFGAFTAALIAGLGALIPVWSSALLVAVIYSAVAGALAMAGRQKVKEVGAPVPETLGRFKNLFTFRTQKIKDELSDMPQQAFSTLSTVKEDVQDAWERGSRHQHGD